jgi:NAD(P)-dependent dehydrogenase (short-subunit alcohol dehydrogenase family)
VRPEAAVVTLPAGKVVVVTGAGQGQGAAEARLLAAEGATVVGCDLLPEAAEELPGVGYRQLDVTDAAGWAALADDLRREHGAVHGLVANAGVTWRARLADLQPADLARVAEVNVTGTLLGIQALTPLMTAGGSVVVVGSVAHGPPAGARRELASGGGQEGPSTWSSARAASGSTPCTPATSRRR